MSKVWRKFEVNYNEKQKFFESPFHHIFDHKTKSLVTETLNCADLQIIDIEILNRNLKLLVVKKIALKIENYG